MTSQVATDGRTEWHDRQPPPVQVFEHVPYEVGIQACALETLLDGRVQQPDLALPVLVLKVADVVSINVQLEPAQLHIVADCRPQACRAVGITQVHVNSHSREAGEARC